MEKKKKGKKKIAQRHAHVWYLVPLGIYATFWGSFIGYICHCGFLWVFLWVFHSLSHSCYAFGVSRVHMRVLSDPILLGSCLIYTRYERWVIFLLRSPDHCLTHHSIIGDMTFLYCTNMGWSSLIPLSHCFLLYPITAFQIFVPPFIHSLHIDTHYWFDTFFTSFTCFTDGLTTYHFSCFTIDIFFGYL